MRKATLLFDSDVTLVQLDRLGAYRQVAADSGSSGVPNLAESLHQRDKELCAQGMPDRHAVFEEYIDKFKVKNIADLCRAFWTRVAEGQVLKPGCIETLGALTADGYVLVCVTDTDGTGGDKHNRVEAAVREYLSGDRVFIGRENTPYPKDRTTRYVEAVMDKL